MNSKDRIFGLDILRFIAVSTVVIGHTFYTLPIGADPTFVRCVFFDGVNIFFTLSGFLIGGILIKKLSEKPATFSTLATFWRDRWLRTLPAYFFILILIIIWEGGHFADYKRHFVFLQNVHTGEFKGYRESWSLSIEEWFYLTTPILFIITLRYLPLRIATPVIIVSIFIAGNIIRAIRMPQVNNYMDLVWRILMSMPTRIDAVAFGLLGAYLQFYKFRIWTDYKKLFFTIGVIGFFANHYYGIFADFSFYSKFLHKQIESAFVLMTLPYLASIKEGKGIVASFITFVALISYSIYLVHAAFFVEVIYPFVPPIMKYQFLAYYGWALVGSVILYYTVERWGLMLRNYLKRRSQQAIVRRINE